MRKKVKELLKRLDESIDQVQSSSEFKEILKTFSKFHNYSFQNSLLIKLQKPEATFVAGYKQWQDKFNRHVKKGEKGIAILAPFTAKKKVIESKEVQVGNTIQEREIEREVKQTYFRPVYVFDVSQTEGEPLPELDLSVGDSLEIDLLDKLIDLAASESLSVEFKPLPDKLDGYINNKTITIKENTDNTEKASIFIHELAHYYLHKNINNKDNITKEIVEMEAESVAYVVMNYFGVDINSDKYLALYKKDYELVESLKYIKSNSKLILDFLIEK